jgi:flagellar FliJ protein
MKRFRFRLERVLQFRERIREERKRDLTACLLALRAAETQLEELRTAELENEIRAQDITTADVELVSLYGKRLKLEIVNTNREIERRSQAVEVARNAYIEASKEAEALQQLKRRRQSEHDLYVSHEEAKLIDEMVTQRYTRREQN